jgi:putative redox protein
MQKGRLMEVTAEYLGDTKFEVAARTHRVVCDQPLENGGTDVGISPPEFLLASLATCAAYYATQYLKARRLTVENLKVRVSAEKGQQPARLASFRIEVMAPGLEEKHETGVMRAVKACLIHNTLRTQPTIEIVLNTVRLGADFEALGADCPRPALPHAICGIASAGVGTNPQ